MLNIYYFLLPFKCSILIWDVFIAIPSLLYPYYVSLQFPAEAVLKHILEAPRLREWFEGGADSGNPDALLLALRIRDKIAVDSEMFGMILPYPFSPSKLFTSDHLSSIINRLKVILLFTCICRVILCRM